MRTALLGSYFRQHYVTQSVHSPVNALPYYLGPILLCSRLRPGLPSGSFRFPARTPYKWTFSPLRATCTAHPMLPHLISISPNSPQHFNTDVPRQLTNRRFWTEWQRPPTAVLPVRTVLRSQPDCRPAIARREAADYLPWNWLAGDGPFALVCTNIINWSFIEIVHLLLGMTVAGRLYRCRTPKYLYFLPSAVCPPLTVHTKSTPTLWTDRR
jgi:hypothetical protein